MDDSDERFQRAAEWAIDHCAVQVNLNARLVVVGDPEVLWSGPVLSAASLRGEAWAIVKLPGGDALLVDGAAGVDGPWLFVTTTSDGPLDVATLQPSIWTDGARASTEGTLLLPSGRLVVGAPATVAAWGPAVTPDDGLSVQTKTGWDSPEPTYVGLVAVAQVAAGVTCPIEVSTTDAGELHSVSIRFPRPGWTPTSLRP